MEAEEFTVRLVNGWLQFVVVSWLIVDCDYGLVVVNLLVAGKVHGLP